MVEEIRQVGGVGVGVSVIMRTLKCAEKKKEPVEVVKDWSGQVTRAGVCEKDMKQIFLDTL